MGQLLKGIFLIWLSGIFHREVSFYMAAAEGEGSGPAGV